MKKFLIILTFFACFASGFSEAATNNDYCVMPLFMTNSVKPNILINMDFSGSMQFAAYLPDNFGSYDGNVADCGTRSISSTANTSYRYDKGRDYFGFFDKTKYYQYGSSSFEENTACTADPNRLGTTATCVSGNFLNWLTTTRIDTARKALTGGRTNTGGGSTYLDSEGAKYVINDYYTGCKYTVSANVTSNRQLSIADISSGTLCALPYKGMSNKNIEVKVPSGVTVEGLIQRFYDKAYFQFMAFSNDYGSFNRFGDILSGKDQPLSSLVSAINNEVPYGGTATGEAMWEAKDYYIQSNDHSYEANSAELNKGNGLKDPYYDGSGSGSLPVPCRKTYILLISDGAWNGSLDPMRAARNLRVTDLRPDATETAMGGIQNVSTYAVYAFGQADPTGRNAMIATAMFGGFDFDSGDEWPYPYTTWPTTNSLGMSFPLSSCDPDPSGTWDVQCGEWDKEKTGLPFNFYEAEDGEQLVAQLEKAINDMLRRASSGTAASVLASSEGSGANMLQAVFYPKRLFNNVEVEWISELQNLWFFIDPWFRGATNIREDSTDNNILDMTSDNVIEFAFDTITSKTMVHRYTPNSDGTKGAETTPSPDDIDNAAAIWKAGDMLFNRNISTSPRNIFTSLDGSTHITLNSTAASNTALQTALQASSSTEAANIIDYVNGSPVAGYRNRTITRNSVTNTWKLGDIISSTPRLKASFPLNTYHMYAPDGYTDQTYSQYVNDVDASGNPAGSYKQRGMAYVGANDGMLHAFELGKLTFSGLATGQIAKLEVTDQALGTERWAFVPKGALPYLKYIAQANYCHLFTVDNPVMIADVSINASGSSSSLSSSQDASHTRDRTSWRTVLIGSMGIGGACRNSTSTCSSSTDCVKTPTANIGYSAYFAIDITDPVNPQLLWEFSREDLGFATSGPAIIRMGDPDKNGKWFVVFASGPTGPINTTEHQFMGSSDQPLKLFVLDLRQGPAATVEVITPSGLSNAFGGSLLSATLDIDRNRQSTGTPYQDDVLYVGYTQKDTATGTWTKGGVVRLLTNGDSNPGNWTPSIFIDNIGPVTSAVTKLIDVKKHNLWIYFGTGRYYYRLNGGATIDDPTNQRALYGVKEPCYTASNTLTNSCTSLVSTGDLVAPSASVPTRGWKINLDAVGTTYKAERVITDPLAIPSGIVFFTTVAPSSDICSFGGQTALWFPWYETGGLPPPAALARLEAMLQVSTGAIIKITGLGSGTITNPKVTVAQGIPSKDQGLSVFTPPPPLRRILHMKEK